MASISEYQLKNGQKRYKIQVYGGLDPLTGKESRIIRKGFKRAKDAKLAANKLENDIANGQHKKTDLTIGDFLTQWITELKVNVKEGSMILYRYNINHYLIPTIGKIRLSKYNLAQHQIFINKLFNEKNLSLNTVKLINGTLSNAFKKAVKIGYIEKNPTIGTEFIKTKVDAEKRKVLHYWENDQVTKFLEAAKNERDQVWYYFFLTIIDTGLRKGEAMALRWSDISFKNNTLTVNKTRIYRDEHGNDEIALDYPKTANSVRTIPLSHRLGKTLRELYRLQHPNVVKVDTASIPLEKIKLPIRDFIFVYKFGKGLPLRSKSTNGAFDRITKRAGLPHIKIHDLRHTHAVLLRQAGVSLDDIKDLLGHKDISTTQIYAHITPQVKEKAMDKYDQLINH